MRYLSVLFVITMALCFAGCSSDDGNGDGWDVGNNGGSNNGGSNNGGSNNGGSNNGATDDPCPTSLPASGDSCNSSGLRCQYGDDPRRECRPVAECTDSGWALQEPACEDPPDATCPATRADAADEKCDTQDAFCTYEDGLVCECTNCVEHPVENCSGDPTWHCEAPNSDADCPAAMPNFGTACSVEGKTCEYECGQGNARLCEDGVWTQEDSFACPISTRRVKRDIRYLEPTDVDRVAAMVQALKLARYRYTDPALAADQQLGIIIEDAPGTPAVDDERSQVDLYGFASMLLAATQAQQREIEALREEVKVLKKRTCEQP